MAFQGYDALKMLSDRENIKKNYSVRTLCPKIERHKYSPNKILLGWDRKGRPLYLNIRTSKIILIVGKRGSGKTLYMRSLVNRTYLSGHIPVVLTDIKGEYKSSEKPVQAKFQHLLAEHEQPVGFPIKSYHPVFLNKYSQRRFPDNIPCQLSIDKITIFDLMSVMGLDLNQNSSKHELLMRAWRKLEERDIFTYNELKDALWEDLDAVVQTKDSVIGSLKTAINEEVLGEEFADFSFTDDALEGYIPILNVSGYEKMRGYGYPSAFISVVARDVIDGKKRGLIDRGTKIFYFIDEAHRWIHSTGSSAAKRTIVNIMREERTTGVSLICATQTIGGLDEAVRKQASIILLPWNIDSPTVIGIMKDVGLYERYGRFTDNLNRNLQSLKKWEWVMIDCDSRDIRIIHQIAGPLSKHYEEM